MLILCYVCCVLRHKWVHNIDHFVDSLENGFVKSMLEVAKRLRSQPVKQKDVVTSDMLVALCDQYTNNTNLTDIRDGDALQDF